MSVLSYPFHSLPLKLPNKGINFQVPPLKLSNKYIKEYSKIILFIPFCSISFPPPKWRLREKRGNTILYFFQYEIRVHWLHLNKYKSSLSHFLFYFMFYQLQLVIFFVSLSEKKLQFVMWFFFSVLNYKEN